MGRRNPRREARKARIYHRRMALNLTQQEMAERMDVHRVTVAKLEQLACPVGEILRRKVAAELGVPEVEVEREYAGCQR